MSSSSYSTSDPSNDEELLIESKCELRKSLLTYAKSMLKDIATSSAPPIKRMVIYREREDVNDRLMRDYLAKYPVYQEDSFKRHFQLSKGLFLRIVNDLQNATSYFTQRWDARNKKCFSPLQKRTSAIRQLAYESVLDSLDEYLQISERTSREVLQKCCKWVIKVYSREYLQQLTSMDIEKLYEHHESTHGFSGMLGSIDCTHWVWRNCPVAWRGQFMRGDHEYPTLMLEAVASQDLWIWHAYFGTAGSNNDINVLHCLLFDDVCSGRAPLRQFQVNGVQYRYGYYLANGIYPEWATFVKSFTYPQDPKRIKFKNAQESTMKDIERAFGVLKALWTILQNPARPWHIKPICRIMYACVILHNMILQDERQAICTFDESDLPTTPVTNIANLRADLVEHINRIRSDVEGHQ